MADECYLAVPKGGLHADHALIVPIAHAGSWLDLPDSTRNEMQRYKEALSRCFGARGKRLLVYERFVAVRGEAPHMHLQVVPVSEDRGAPALAAARATRR